MHDQVAQIIKFQMRNDKIETQDDGPDGFMQLERDPVEIPGYEQNAADDHEADGGIGGRRGEDQRSKERERHDHPEHEPVHHSGLKIIQERPLMRPAGGQRSEEQIKAEQGQTAGHPAAQEFS